MELFKHSLEILPPDWITFLDPSSFLELQCAHSSSFSDAQCIESFWCNLCRNQLLSFLSGRSSKVEIHLDTKSVKHSLTRKGGLSEIVGFMGQADRDLTKHERQRLWSKAYRDMICDVRQTCPCQSASDSREPKSPLGSRLSGSLWMTVGNELRHNLSDFQFPALLNAPDWNGEQIACLLNEVEIKKDHFQRHTSCRLQAPLGGDRCVMALQPLPRLGVATVFLGPTAWQVAWRPCSYYEVEIKAAKAATASRSIPAVFPRRGSSGGRSECVSVGLALATIPWRGICHQQAGWNHSSWALHGDDGQLYHSHGQGTPFRPLKNFVLKGAADADEDHGIPVIDLTTEEPQVAPSAKLRRTVPQFGAGDVVGCGVAKFQNSFGIFFTLNGHFLGVGFQFRAAQEPRLWPCVGIDATWELAFNFGSRPFVFDTMQVIQELPLRNLQCDNLSSLLMQYPSAHWPGEAFADAGNSESESDGTFVHASRWSEDASDSENSYSDNYILE